VRAFLTSDDGGLGLRIARDADTSRVLLQALPRLLAQPLADWQGKEIDATDLNELLSPDTTKTLLKWMHAPAPTKQAMDAAEWAAFATTCKNTYGVNPDTSDVTKAGEKLARRSGPWAMVWERFAEAPKAYPGMVPLLRRSKPAGELFGNDKAEPYAYPQDNEEAEATVRAALAALAGRAENEARTVVAKLENDHAARRGMVWADLGDAPLAMALQHLAALAVATQKPLAGASLADAMTMYANEGWRTDSAAIEALAAVKAKADHDAVGAAVKSLYGEWLNKSAVAFQKLAADGYPVATGETLSGPGVLLFADGLRLDVARRLEEVLQARGLAVDFTTRLAALPTATVTAKPAVSPIAAMVKGADGAREFELTIIATGKPYTSGSLKPQLDAAGYTHLGANAIPVGGDVVTARHWTEFGTLDRRGHNEQAKLASFVAGEVEQLADRIAALLESGTPEVKVVTDHGWLLLPGGLPKVELPKSMTDTKWPRCAALKPGATVEFKTFPWRFDDNVRVVSPPGCAIFQSNDAYSHGGISPQECITPVLMVRLARGGARRGVAITGVEFKKMVVRITVTGAEGLTMDVRLDASNAASTVMDARAGSTIEGGKCRLYLDGDVADKYIGQLAEAVVLDGSGAVMARYKVTLPQI